MTPESALTLADERRALLGMLVPLRISTCPAGFAVGTSRHSMSVGPTIAAACLAWCEAHPLVEGIEVQS